MNNSNLYTIKSQRKPEIVPPEPKEIPDYPEVPERKPEPSTIPEEPNIEPPQEPPTILPEEEPDEI